MGNYLPIICATLVYILIFVYLIASTQIEGLREDWPSVRCQPMAMFFASYIPTDPEVNRSKFSSDNFQFCIQKLVDSSISLVMGPILGVFASQISVAKTTQQSANSLRNSAASDVASPFNSLINFAWKRFGNVLTQILRVMYKLNSSFQRIFGVTLASVFAGFSVFKAFNNSVQLIIKVCIILLIIIIALLFLIFIPISPFIGIILIPVIAGIAATEYGSQVGGMEGSFNCVTAGTLVKTKTGWTNVEDLNLGDSLYDGKVEGILRGKGSPSVSINSIVISRLHIVFDSSVDRWVFAKDHVDAVPCETPSLVYSLVTSNRTWTVYGTKELILRDWTHAKEGDEERIQRKICSFLGVPFTEVRGIGLVGPESMVWKEGYGPCHISSLRIGDRVSDGEGMTEVTSIYDSTEEGNSSGPNRSVWTLAGVWQQKSVAQKGVQVPLMYCATESGKIRVNGEILRDFNEIDSEHFYELEEFLLSLFYN
jgi:hypothetical protein